jgi:hypothetical protein
MLHWGVFLHKHPNVTHRFFFTNRCVGIMIGVGKDDKNKNQNDTNAGALFQ